jgi:hypothetical protein
MSYLPGGETCWGSWSMTYLIRWCCCYSSSTVVDPASSILFCPSLGHWRIWSDHGFCPKLASQWRIQWPHRDLCFAAVPSQKSFALATAGCFVFQLCKFTFLLSKPFESKSQWSRWCGCKEKGVVQNSFLLYIIMLPLRFLYIVLISIACSGPGWLPVHGSGLWFNINLTL